MKVAHAIATVCRFLTGAAFYAVGSLGVLLASHPEAAVIVAVLVGIAVGRWM